MNRTARFVLGALLVLGLGLLGSYLLGRAEPYEDVVSHGPSPEARANPYMAAEHFLRKQGLEVARADNLAGLATLPSRGHTLLLLGNRSNLTPRQSERLLQWAAQGGHLLFVAERMWDEEEGKSGDLLLDALGVQQYPVEKLDEYGEETSDSAGEESEEESTDAYPELTKLYLENEQAPAYIDFDTDFHLYDANNLAHVWANSGEATHLLQIYHGEGLISVVTDAWIWQNPSLADHDNAWLLWYLSQDSAVTLVYNADRDNLLTLLQRHFAPALLALGLLVALVLWHVGQRQGPLLQPQPASRRQLQEHLRGAADFLLRHGGQQRLLNNLQQDILRRARRRHPGFERLGVAEQWQILGRLSRQPSTAISQAMRPLSKKRLSANDFTRQVAHLQTLRNAL
ncbi:DUF4350 domain-containing protein [Pseudomonas daroniae]|uniref:DUF4350 domain-containing protein n=1 Tax=Phytopseudomonas daroniae TaxID=2487519 RepID=A0A4Q9QNI3_9GAMM|nr:MULTISPECIES: DUF4350 domain-containing protein [Pseudomonas]TBU80675.1 DUF4350 domain-containing protein [Pseudomonas daroniae]TBU81710.1 DUF4350 domain-containing protein [Pseudomonas sp. FRB 228]TBU90700.1 DUF4350 domain-containing protein [Pseudomonas daroniae]